jgi:GEVED domain
MRTPRHHPVLTMAAGLTLVAASAPAAGALATSTTGAVTTAAVAADGTTVAWQSEKHTFTMDDVVGNALGETDADNPNVIKDGDAGETLTGEDNIVAKDGGTLYPINSTFSFDVQDFVGATEKTFDTVAEEGWVGEFSDDLGSGVQFVDQETDELKAGNLIGTWAAGLGGSDVKASTEHYTVMEAVLTCFQTVPYDYWDSKEDFDEGLPSVPSLADVTRCAENRLPNPVGDEAMDAAVADAIALLEPNEDSVIPSPTDLYLGTNYSVTEKDDGKVLYRWGQAVKRPSDIRFTTSLALPDEWYEVPEGERGYTVTKAELVLKHAVTNNPNDQIRPEDWENEGATGLLPDYTVADDGTWLSTKACFEGDGDFIPAGTVLRDPALGVEGAPSSDLGGGFSNAWYTTIDRDPFQWAYLTGDGSKVGSSVPDDSLGDLVSGPRWRFLSNKFGQDIPSLEVPAITCDEPPYEKGTIKYEVGDIVETRINLLDWSTDPLDARWDATDTGDAAQSPFAYSAGWMTSWAGAEAADHVDGQLTYPGDEDRCLNGSAADGTCVSSLGTKLTDGFDVALYVKGDQKPLKVYDLYIEVEYEGGTEPTYEYDFGDAPATYGTDAISAVVGDVYLGATVDAEPSALVSDDATGDDVTGTDDEDGVTFPEDGFAVGEESTVTFDRTGEGTLSAWFDWNADGMFVDAEMYAVEGESLTLTVPADAAAGPTFARFMMTDVDGVGEVEDYAIMVGGVDFGDAPESYGDASHTITALTMKTIDAEQASQYSPDATGDDTAGIDDEDGVGLAKFVTGKSSTVRVTATAAGKLDAWIDWNHDGTFGEDELVADALSVRDGTISFKVAVPENNILGTTFARFRVSEEGSLDPTGRAVSGEVEDHVITVSGK